MYNKVTAADIEYFASFIPSERLAAGDNVSEDYSHDELGGVKRLQAVLQAPNRPRFLFLCPLRLSSRPPKYPIPSVFRLSPQ